MRRAFFFLLLLFTFATSSDADTRVIQNATRAHTSGVDEPLQKSATGMESAAVFTQEDVQAFVDGIIPGQLVHGDLAGAAVVVIKDGKVLLQKGYGEADVERHTPVDPAQTIFRFGSISKLLTYVSVMQLVEQGKLDLDTDINRYLDFQIAPAFDKPITIRNLMTHTAGFEDQQQYLLASGKPLPLRNYLERFQPRRIYPPGHIGAYSGYGVGLLGYIVQRTSGERFEDYVKNHIFVPLNMGHSTFEQPLPEDLHRLLSQGYFATDQAPVAFEVFNTSPAGGMSSTVVDAARFAQSLLNGGELEGHRILKEETVHLMWTRQFAVSPSLPAMCLGFYQVASNGLRFVGHVGDTRVFHTQLEIQPENHFIFLLAFNSDGADGSGGDKARPAVFGAMLDRYFPYKESHKWQPVDNAARGIEGTFIQARRMESGRLKLDSLFNQTRIKINQEGELINRKAIDDRGHAIRLRYLGTDLWEDEVGQGKIMSLRNSQGKVDRLASMFGATMMIRVPWYENGQLIIPLAAFALITTTLVSCISLISLFSMARSRKRRNETSRQRHSAYGSFTKFQIWAGIVWLPAVVIPLKVVQHIAKQPLPNYALIPIWFSLQNVMILTAILLSLPAFVQAGRSFLNQKNPPIARLTAVGITFSYIFLTWFSLHWHLLGSSSRY